LSNHPSGEQVLDESPAVEKHGSAILFVQSDETGEVVERGVDDWKISGTGGNILTF